MGTHFNNVSRTDSFFGGWGTSHLKFSIVLLKASEGPYSRGTPRNAWAMEKMRSNFTNTEHAEHQEELTHAVCQITHTLTHTHLL